MEKLITHNRNALRLLMTEDLYIIDKDASQSTVQATSEPEQILPEVKTEESKQISFSYLGENNRYFLILVDDASHPELNTAHKEMLMKIMAAKKLEMRDLAIVNLAKYQGVSFDELKAFFSCNRLTLFGIAPQVIGLPAIGSNEPVNHLGTKILATFSLGEMSSNTDKKREFWNVMKEF